MEETNIPEIIEETVEEVIESTDSVSTDDTPLA